MPQVVIRTPAEADDDLLYRIAADLATWDERDPAPPTPLPRAAWTARRDRRTEDGSAQFVVVADGTPVGQASLFAVDPLARHAEIGIALVPEARGRGVGTAAVRLLADFAFVRLNLRRLHLEAIASNAGAIRAYEKAGFVVEGRQRQHAWVRGGYEDVVRMGLLREEWS